jgi:hypothetical protein
VFYVGQHESIDHALRQMPRKARVLRATATRMGREGLRADADALAERHDALRRLVEEHPDLLERARVERQRARGRHSDQQTAENR